MCFTYSANGARQNLDTFLEKSEGTLLTDAYTAYEPVAANRPGVTHAQCWAHAWRGFERAEPSEHETVPEAMEFIGMLYRVETEIRRKLTDCQAKQTYRTFHSLPVVETFLESVNEQCNRVDLLNNDPFTNALFYVAERDATLRIFACNLYISIATNHLERAFRVIAMGRCNWVFSWTEACARHMGVIQILLVTCRLQNVASYNYLVDVLHRISLHPAPGIEDTHSPALEREIYRQANVL